MIVLTYCGEDMLFVPTWMIAKSTNLKFILPEETNSESLPMVAPGKAWVVQPWIPPTYFGIEAETIVPLFSVKPPANCYQKFWSNYT
jgi:hypothetical protein